MASGIPERFDNVQVGTKANVFFDGRVISHSFWLASGERKTLGLIFAGSYHFGTDAPERMEMVAGTAQVKLDGQDDWVTYGAGEAFEVPGQSGFDIAVADGIAEYVCSFLA